MKRAILVGTAFFSFAAAILMITSCSANQIYEIKIEAMRATSFAAKPVSMSFWIYDSDGKDISHIFIPGKIDTKVNGLHWYDFSNINYSTVPAHTISKTGELNYTIKLNPNRMVTKPDGVFYFAADLRKSFPNKSSGVDRTILSTTDGMYEIRVTLRQGFDK